MSYQCKAATRNKKNFLHWELKQQTWMEITVLPSLMPVIVIHKIHIFFQTMSQKTKTKNLLIELSYSAGRSESSDHNVKNILN